MKTFKLVLIISNLFFVVSSLFPQEQKFQGGLKIKWMMAVDNGEGVDKPHGPVGNFHLRVYIAQQTCFGQQKFYPGGLIHDYILQGPSTNEWDDGDFFSYESFGGHFVWGWLWQIIKVFIYESDPTIWKGIYVPYRSHDPVFCQNISSNDFTNSNELLLGGPYLANDDAVERAWQMKPDNMNMLLDILEVDWPEHYAEIMNGGQFYKVYICFENTNVPWVNQTIQLNQGWNFVSFQPDLTGISITDLLESNLNDNSVLEILDSEGGICTYLPSNQGEGGYRNNIKYISRTSGYAINMSQPTTINVEGMQLKLPIELKLKQGWNLVGYPLLYPGNAQNIVQPLINSGILNQVIDETDKKIFKLPNGTWINTIGNFIPGKAYYINVSEETTFYLQ